MFGLIQKKEMTMLNLSDINLRGNRVIVKMLPHGDRLRSGLYIPQKNFNNRFDKAEIVLVGKDFHDEAKLGDIVIFSIYAGIYNAEIDFGDGETYYLLNAADLWAIVERDAEIM
jgi:co-chaperonin GroES (HSP10)